MAPRLHVEAIWAAALLLLLGQVVAAADEGEREEENSAVRAGLPRRCALGVSAGEPRPATGAQKT